MGGDEKEITNRSNRCNWDSGGGFQGCGNWGRRNRGLDILGMDGSEKKTKIFHDQMEPKLAEKRLKRLKVFLLVAGISFVVGIVGIVMHNVMYVQTEIEESVFFVTGLVGLYVSIIATGSGLVILLKGRRKTT